MLCEYGCGREAFYQFKNGKWCCSKHYNGCMAMVKKCNKPKASIEYFGPAICSYGCGQIAKFRMNNGKLCCSKSMNSCPESKRRHSVSLIGNKPKTSIEYFGFELCSYGCGKIAKFRMNNGKLCCSKSMNSCIKKKDIIRPSIEYFGFELCSYGCRKIAKFRMNNGKLCCSKYISQCLEIRIKNSNLNIGRKKSEETKKRMSIGSSSKFFSKEHRRKIGICSLKENRSKETLKKMSIKQRRTIEKTKEDYPTFSKIEEMRYNPDKPIEEKEIQVHCKNHNCENSKEKGGWFTPTKIQIVERIRCIEINGTDNSYFYCSQYCKITCPLYGLQSDPFKEKPEEVFRSKVWSDQVLKQDSYECQICGSKENLHCHHIQPVKLEPEYSLDPDNGIVLCNKCHTKYGHKSGTECSTANLAKVICKKKKKGNN